MKNQPGGGGGGKAGDGMDNDVSSVVLHWAFIRWEQNLQLLAC